MFFLWEIGEFAIIKMCSCSWRKRTWIICALNCCLSVVCKDQSASILLLFVWCTWGRSCDYQRRAQRKDQCASTKGQQCSLSYLAPMMPFCFRFFHAFLLLGWPESPATSFANNAPLSPRSPGESVVLTVVFQLLSPPPVKGGDRLQQLWCGFWVLFHTLSQGDLEHPMYINFEQSNHSGKITGPDLPRLVVFWHPFFSNRLSNWYMLSPILRGNNFQNMLKTSA